ncbi:hypothetical protein [Pseudoclavibacter sp. Z016]|uniref:hypothetical protein n=1 Tax=Pseudoclavibacter sp. Z016 TaxID=2080581 RepID=UPI0011AFD328|nr:hypothetical protein [Pseudoclavibacter sp. Z016]
MPASNTGPRAGEELPPKLRRALQRRPSSSTSPVSLVSWRRYRVGAPVGTVLTSTSNGPLDLQFDATTDSSVGVQQRATITALKGVGRHLAVPPARGSRATQLSIAFSRAVQGVSFSLLKIPGVDDEDARIVVTSSGLTFERERGLGGDGSEADPFRNLGSRQRSLRLSWRGPVSRLVVQLIHGQQDDDARVLLRLSDLVLLDAVASSSDPDPEAESGPRPTAWGKSED